MTLPPQSHPQYELKRRIADCRERLRRTRTGQKTATGAPSTQTHGANDEATSDETDDAHTRPQRATARRATRR